MGKRAARRRRAAHRAKETRMSADTMTRDLLRQSRRIAQLQMLRRRKDRELAKLTDQIKAAQQQLKAWADAAVNDASRQVGELKGDA